MAGSKPVVRQGALTVGLAVLLVVSLPDQLPALASARGAKGTGFDALESFAGRWLLAQLNSSSPSDEEHLEELIRREGPLRAKGAYAEAALLWEKIVAIAERTLGPDHPGTAKSLNNLAELYRAQGRLSDAEPLYQRSLVIYEKKLGPEHSGVATSLNNLALVYQAQARYADAERLFIRSLSILEKVEGPQSTQTAASLGGLGLLFYKQARFKEAEPLFKRSLAIFERALGPEHPNTATGLNNLAGLCQAQGRYEEAEPLYKRSLAIREKVLGPEHPDTAQSLNNLALLYVDQGRHGEAEPLYKRSLAIDEKALGPEHPSTATSLNNLAELYQVQGRYGDAEQLFKRTMGILEKALGPEHPDIATSLNNLAEIYRLGGRYKEAEPLLKRSLAIDEKALGSENLSSANSFNKLAALYRDQGRYGESEPLYKRSLVIREKVLGPEHPDTATSLNNLATLYEAQGRYNQAEPLLKRALAINEKVWGLEHTSTATSLKNLALMYLALSKAPAAELFLQRLNLAQANWLRRELASQPRELRESLINKQPDTIATTFALLDQHPAAVPLALETRLNRQGLLAEIERRQALLRASIPETLRLAERAAGIDQNLSSITLLPAQREALRQQRQQLETQLYRLLPALKIDPVSNAQVATALKAAAPQGLLVEFQKYRPYEKDAKGTPNWGTARYVALLLKPEGTIRAIPLGEAKAIDEAVKVALTATVKNEQRQTQALAVLSQRVFGPLQPHLSGVNVLFLSPDAELNRVPFAALPSPADPGRYLSEAFQLRILTTGRDLVRLQQPIQAAGGQTAGSNVLMADPDYGPITGTSSTPTLPSWLPLPYTRAEAEQIKGLLNVRQLFLGREATAARVLRSRGPRMLHIATHGYFQPEAVTQPNSQLQLENQEPLQRTYLALAGANMPNTNAVDDGRLTAAEATGMDLAGTELVTLSACDTARGEIRSGEGVYGLQRALTVAGARSTLLSLWRVGDQRTAVFMAEFYKRLKAGQPRADALRDTQAFFRKHPDSTYRDVYAWGGFQLTGDWRPVEGL